MTSPMRSRTALAVIVLASALPLTEAAGAVQRDTIRPGVVTDTVHAASDTSQTYALYLPRAYDRSHHWPVLFLMDPRGRALVPMRLFRAAAERYGYIVMSSYQTQSDGAIEPNDRAVNALLSDAQSRFVVDARRFYFAGFSGTARLAWNYGYSIPQNVAGLIEVGAGLPNPQLLLQRSIAKETTPFAVFLSVGTTDFNYDEVRALDTKLEAFGIRHHLEFFDGPHSWPPESVCANAISWLQLQGMRDGRLPVNTAWIDSIYTATVASTDSTARIDPYTAYLLYRQTAADFSGLRDTKTVVDAAAGLAASDAVKRAARRTSDLASESQTALEREDSFFSDFSAADKPPALDWLRSALKLEELANHARQSADPLGALAARRQLASIYVRASFYEPRRYLVQADTLKALTLYALAQAIQPDNTQLCAERNELYRKYAIRKSVGPELGCDRRH
jgi:predicted esterase